MNSAVLAISIVVVVIGAAVLQFLGQPIIGGVLILAGIILALTPGIVNWHSGWIYVKLFAVLLLAGFHGALGGWRRAFLHDRNRKPQRFFRIANEVPTLLMVVAVIMVVVQPF